MDSAVKKVETTVQMDNVNKLLFRDLKLLWSEGLSKTVKQHVKASDISVQTYFKATKTSDGKILTFI